jgi:hypothetical protein
MYFKKVCVHFLILSPFCGNMAILRRKQRRSSVVQITTYLLFGHFGIAVHASEKKQLSYFKKSNSFRYCTFDLEP